MSKGNKYNGTKIVSSTNNAERTRQSHIKSESRNKPYTFHKILLKVDHWPKYKMQNYILLEDNIKENLHDF